MGEPATATTTKATIARRTDASETDFDMPPSPRHIAIMVKPPDKTMILTAAANSGHSSPVIRHASQRLGHGMMSAKRRHVGHDPQKQVKRSTTITEMAAMADGIKNVRAS
jgi:hypothetical protein